MVHDGLMTLDNNRKGASRQELWKCVSSKFPEADHKMFLVRMKKLAADKINGIEHVNGNKQRFRLTSSFMQKIHRRVNKGLDMIKAAKSIVTLKPIKVAQKKRKSKKQNKEKKPKK